jgi:hypothetical protein
VLSLVASSCLFESLLPNARTTVLAQKIYVPAKFKIPVFTFTFPDLSLLYFATRLDAQIIQNNHQQKFPETELKIQLQIMLLVDILGFKSLTYIFVFH